MKKILSLLLVALLSLTGLAALAEPVRYADMGLAFDFSGVEAQSENFPFLMSTIVLTEEPYAAMMAVAYYAMPRASYDALSAQYRQAGDEAERDALRALIESVYGEIGIVFVTNAESIEAAVGSLEEDFTATEFATLDDYHYYFITSTIEVLTEDYGDLGDAEKYGVAPRCSQEALMADIERVQTAAFEALKNAEIFEPTDPGEEMIGQGLNFASVDLDGNAVQSIDLYKANKITMVNCWGTWCGNCLNEMDALAALQQSYQEKGCGIIGVEWEQDPIDEVADTARQVFAEHGITYPNVVMPEGHPILDTVNAFPTTFFVDSEGRILTAPIVGAYVEQYEATLDTLLAGEAVETVAETVAVANGGSAYHVTVCDTDGNPVKGAVVQFCDDTTCALQKTNDDGVVTFEVDTEKVYEVHVAKAPDGYVADETVYYTLDTYSDMTLYISKAE